MHKWHPDAASYVAFPEVKSEDRDNEDEEDEEIDPGTFMQGYMGRQLAIRALVGEESVMVMVVAMIRMRRSDV